MADLRRLKDYFHPSQLRFRDDSDTIMVYTTARVVQKRLDRVVGPQNWQSKANVVGDGFIVSLGILTPENGWVWKADGGEPTNFSEIKGGISDAFKRAAFQWGIGRYFYEMDLWSKEVPEDYLPQNQDKSNLGLTYAEETKFYNLLHGEYGLPTEGVRDLLHGAAREIGSSSASGTDGWREQLQGVTLGEVSELHELVVHMAEQTVDADE